MLEFILIGCYFFLLVTFFFLIIKRVRKLNLWHARETWVEALKYWCILIRRRLIIIFVILFIISSTIILNLI